MIPGSATSACASRLLPFRGTSSLIHTSQRLAHSGNSGAESDTSSAKEHHSKGIAKTAS